MDNTKNAENTTSIAKDSSQTYRSVEFLLAIATLLVYIGIILSIPALRSLPPLPPIFRNVVITIIIIYVAREYYKTRNNVILYLYTSVLFLLAVELIELQVRRVADIGPISLIFHLATSLILLLGSLFFFYLFFETFQSQSLYNHKNTVLSVLFTVFTTGILLCVSYLGIMTVLLERPTEDVLMSQVLFLPLLVSYVFFILMGSILVIYLGWAIIRSINHRIHEGDNEEVNAILGRMRWGALIMIFGPLITITVVTLISNYIDTSFTPQQNILSGSVVSTVGLAIIFHNYRKGGIFLLQSEGLRRLLILNPAGIPIYSYLFRHFDQDDPSQKNRDNQEVLFSGAMQSISMLLSEFTGADKSIKLIKLDDLVLVIKSIRLNHQFSIILIVDHETPFFTEAINQFTVAITDLLREISSNTAFNSNQYKLANQMVEQTFGHGYYQQIGEQTDYSSP